MRHFQPQLIHRDHIEIRLHPHRDNPAIQQARRTGGVRGLPLDQPGQAEAAAVLAPVLQEEGRETGIADQPDMRAAVAEADHRVGVGDHLGAALQVTRRVVGHRHVEEVAAVVLQQQVVGHRLGLTPFPLGNRGNRGFPPGVVVRWIADPVEVGVVVQLRPQQRMARLIDLRQQALAQLRLAHPRHPFVQRQVGDFLVARAFAEHVQAALQAEQHADAARGDLRAHRQAVAHRLGGQLQHTPPVIRRAVALRQGERQRPPGNLDQPAQHGEFGFHVEEVGDHLQHATPGVLQAQGDGDQLFLRRAQARRRIALDRLVVQRARSGETDGAGTHRRSSQLAHARHVLHCGHLQAHGALAHHIEAQRGVGQLRAAIDIAGTRFQRGEKVVEALPLPVQPFVQGDAGNVLDAFHQLDQHFAVALAHRGETDAAVAHHHGGHPMVARRRQAVVPHGLGVVVGVDIDEAGRDQMTAGVDFLHAMAGDLPHLDDAPVPDRHVGAIGLATQPVGNVAATDHQIELRTHATSSADRRPTLAELRTKPLYPCAATSSQIPR
ncbi:hypothetical protein D9M71_275460 [compost metagenome]